MAQSNVKPGEFVPDAINIDTGYEELTVDGKTAFFDRHSPFSGRNTSATQKVYKGLTETGLLRAEPYLDELVDFVTKCDNMTFPKDGGYNFFRDSYRTMRGLSRYVRFPNLVQFFKDGKDYNQPLSQAGLEKYGLIFRKRDGTLINRSEQQREAADASLGKLM